MVVEKSLTTEDGRLAVPQNELESLPGPSLDVLASSDSKVLDADVEIKASDDGVEATSYEECRVKPPEYWHSVLTEHNVFECGRNVTKQLGFASGCVKRHSGDVVRSGKLQMIIDRIQPANALQILLCPPPNAPVATKATYSIILPAAKNCKDKSVKFPRKTKLQLLGLFLKELIAGTVQGDAARKFCHHWRRIQTDMTVNVEQKDLFDVEAPMMAHVGGTLEENSEVAYHVLLHDIIAPSLACGEKTVPSQMVLTGIIKTDLRAWSAQVEEVPTAIEDIMSLCDIVEEVPKTNSPTPRLQLLQKVACAKEDAEDVPRVYSDVSVAMYQNSYYKNILLDIVKNFEEYKTGYASLRKVTSEIRKVFSTGDLKAVADLLQEVYSLRPSVRQGATGEAEMLVRTRLHEWYLEAKDQPTTEPYAADLVHIKNTIDVWFKCHPDGKELLSATAWADQQLGHNAGLVQLAQFATVLSAFMALGGRIFERDFTPIVDALISISTQKLVGDGLAQAKALVDAALNDALSSFPNDHSKKMVIVADLAKLIEENGVLVRACKCALKAYEIHSKYVEFAGLGDTENARVQVEGADQCLVAISTLAKEAAEDLPCERLRDTALCTMVKDELANAKSANEKWASVTLAAVQGEAADSKRLSFGNSATATWYSELTEKSPLTEVQVQGKATLLKCSPKQYKDTAEMLQKKVNDVQGVCGSLQLPKDNLKDVQKIIGDLWLRYMEGLVMAIPEDEKLSKTGRKKKAHGVEKLVMGKCNIAQASPSVLKLIDDIKSMSELETDEI